MSNKVSEMFDGLTDNFKGMIDANSVVGEPIIVGNGTMIVPISKVSFGFGGGGCEFDRKNNEPETPNDKNFGGGMGGGASVDAMAFLVINNGNVRLIPMGNELSPVDKLIDLVPELVDKVNDFFAAIRKKKAVEKNENDINKINDMGEKDDNNER